MTKDTQSGKRSIRNSGQYASNIKKLRLEAGLTASQLAEAIGVTKNAIYNWEAGSHRPDLDTLPQLCDALMVTADELLGHSTPNLNLSEHQLLRKFRRLSSYDQMSIMGHIIHICMERKTIQIKENANEPPKDFCKPAKEFSLIVHIVNIHEKLLTMIVMACFAQFEKHITISVKQEIHRLAITHEANIPIQPLVSKLDSQFASFTSGLFRDRIKNERICLLNKIQALLYSLLLLLGFRHKIPPKERVAPA